MFFVFTGFRLIYIPASVLSQSGHGLPWLTATAGLVLTFGLEALVRRRRRRPRPQERRGGLAATLVGLVLLGLFPEEAPIGVILWAGVGAAWGTAAQGDAMLPRRTGDWLRLLAGAALGVSGLFGPGSWIMALALLVREVVITVRE